MKKQINSYTFKSPTLLQTALTHTSYANENREKKLTSNQRLEFLGDSVLSIIVSQHIYTKYPNLPEGELTRIRAAVVCEKALSECANAIGLGEVLLLGKGEATSGGKERPSILSDAFESLLAAIYLDSGMDSTRDFLLPLLLNKIELAASGSDDFADYKTQFQELIQREQGKRIEYITVDSTGPDHDRIYVINLKVNGKTVGTGEGKSKKEAEQNAAKSAIDTIKN